MKTRSINTVKLPSGKRVPAFGLGTWYMGEDPATQAEELATLRLGLDMGATTNSYAPDRGKTARSHNQSTLVLSRHNKLYSIYGPK
jgi:diketogulonate reductase-like aldo/keto reductase